MAIRFISEFYLYDKDGNKVTLAQAISAATLHKQMTVAA